LDTPLGQRWYQVTITTFKQPEFARIVVAHEDVTELVNGRQSIADLNARLNSIQEEERQRIAIELHDSTAQYLVAAGLTMNRLQGLVTRSDAQKLCNDIELMIEDALKELRTFTYLLHPIGLSSDGLTVTLQRFAFGLQKRSSLEVHLLLDSGIDELPFE